MTRNERSYQNTAFQGSQYGWSRDRKDCKSFDSCRVAVPPYLHLRRHDVDCLLAIDDGRAAVEAGEGAETATDGADLGDD